MSSKKFQQEHADLAEASWILPELYRGPQPRMRNKYEITDHRFPEKGVILYGRLMKPASLKIKVCGKKQQIDQEVHPVKVSLADKVRMVRMIVSE